VIARFGSHSRFIGEQDVVCGEEYQHNQREDKGNERGQRVPLQWHGLSMEQRFRRYFADLVEWSNRNDVKSVASTADGPPSLIRNRAWLYTLQEILQDQIH